MRVLHLSTNDINGGAARAMYRSHTALRQAGIESLVLVQEKKSDDPAVFRFQPRLHWIDSCLRPRLDRLPVRLLHGRDVGIFSCQWVPDRLTSTINAINPDIVHLHWTQGGFTRIETLRSIKKPLVWTLHDMWAFTGGCHYDRGCEGYKKACGKCPELESKNEHDLSSWILKRKLRAWQDLNIHILTPSRWLADCARNSRLFSRSSVEVIPNGLDTRTYRPIPKNTARSLLNIPQDALFIAYGAMNAVSDKRKGFSQLQSALQITKKRAHLANVNVIIFGASSPNRSQDTPFPYYYLGSLHDDLTLALVYSAADVMVVPSLQDNLPNTAIESMACGTPVVAFDTSGLSDIVDHKINGYLAKPYSPEDLAAGVMWILENSSRREELSAQARKKSLTTYSYETHARHLIAAYSSITSHR